MRFFTGAVVAKLWLMACKRCPWDAAWFLVSIREVITGVELAEVTFIA